MLEDLIQIVNAPLCNLCILAGLIFLAIALIGKISGNIECGKTERKIAGLIGGILLITGLILINSTSSTGSIYISSSPSGANIFLNDDFKGKTPTTLKDIKPGFYNILLKSEGYQDWSETIQIEANVNTIKSPSLIPISTQVSTVTRATTTPTPTSTISAPTTPPPTSTISAPTTPPPTSTTPAPTTPTPTSTTPAPTTPTPTSTTPAPTTPTPTSTTPAPTTPTPTSTIPTPELKTSLAPGKADTSIKKHNSTAFYYNEEYIDAGSSVTGGRSRSLLSFDLSQFAGTSIQKATLRLYWYYEFRGRDKTTTVQIFRPIKPWDSRKTNWNQYDSGNNWDNSGSDWADKNGITQGNIPFASRDFPIYPDNQYHEFDVTDLVKKYVDGIHPNYGFLIKASDESPINYIAFKGLDASKNNPQLEITAISH